MKILTNSSMNFNAASPQLDQNDLQHLGFGARGKRDDRYVKHSPVGGLEHVLFFPYIFGIIIPTDFHIFQRGRYTTNQIGILVEGKPEFFREKPEVSRTSFCETRGLCFKPSKERVWLVKVYTHT